MVAAEIIKKAARVRLLALDVDGVLTDGKIILNEAGGELKLFHVRDGSALVRARRAGLVIALISGRESEAVRRRADELGIEEVYLGARDKVSVLNALRNKYGCKPEETAFLGDDLNDLPVLEEAGFSVLVADAHPALNGAADYRLSLPGGQEAVRSLIDLILNSRRLWGNTLK
ncbi:MAG: HAD-IIIA family hydrolase [Euryarchaeota archaeon]|nr:HAD-IIIA family hydrolase [Euryarchaeota archaeon]